MITQKSYQSLFRKVYYIALALCFLAYLCNGYFAYSHSTESEIPFLFEELRSFIFTSFGLFFFFPALITWVIMGIVRLTNKLEPAPEEQAKQSPVERQTKLQLFGIIGFALLLPFIVCRVLDIYLDITYQPRWLIYLGIIVHGLFSFVVVLLLRGISKCRKMGWKIVIAAIMVFAMFIYLVTLYRVFSSDRENEYPTADECYEYNDDPDADFAEADPESLAYQQVTDALRLFDNQHSFLITASNFIPFDPDYFSRYFDSSAVPDGASDAEVDQLYAKNRQQDSTYYRLSRFYNWLFVKMDSETFEPMIDKLKMALLRHGGKIDYKQYAQRIDMLDLAFRELTPEGQEYNFYQVYEYATEHPLKWELYAAKFITDPYIRSTVEGDDQAKELLLWAYTFWGRRDNEGSLWSWRYALDQLLEVHPNTHYPVQEVYIQRELMRNAEQRAVAFLKWYKANYWSFREMPIAEYNESGSLAKYDPEQAKKYLYALEKSGFLSSKLLQKVRTKFDETEVTYGVKVGNVGRNGEWLRTDPLIPGYDTVARGIDHAECHTDYIRQAGQDMQLSLSGGLTIDMECINGEWVIYHMEEAGPK